MSTLPSKPKIALDKTPDPASENRLDFDAPRQPHGKIIVEPRARPRR